MNERGSFPPGHPHDTVQLTHSCGHDGEMSYPRGASFVEVGLAKLRTKPCRVCRQIAREHKVEEAERVRLAKREAAQIKHQQLIYQAQVAKRQRQEDRKVFWRNAEQRQASNARVVSALHCECKITMEYRDGSWVAEALLLGHLRLKVRSHNPVAAVLKLARVWYTRRAALGLDPGSPPGEGRIDADTTSRDGADHG